MYIDELVKDAENSDLASTIELATRYYFGDGVNENHEKMFYWFNKAYDMDDKNPDILNFLGMCYSYGYGVKQDNEKALELYLKGIDLGYANCMYGLAEFYRNISSEKNKCVEWYEKAKDRGNTESMYHLACMYRDGIIVVQDKNKALELFKIASENGHEKARFFLGAYHFSGEFGINIDKDKAIELWQEASELNHEVATNIAICYRDGLFVEKDTKKAVEYFEKAYELGSMEAAAYLAKGYDDGGFAPTNLEKAELYYQVCAGTNIFNEEKTDIELRKKAAEMGNTDEMIELGIMYDEGINVEKDLSKSAMYWERAYELGNENALDYAKKIYTQWKKYNIDPIKAVEFFNNNAKDDSVIQYELAKAYQYGIGTAQDYTEAEKWYIKAAENNHAASQTQLGYFYLTGLSECKDNKDKALYWFEKAAENKDVIAMTECANILIDQEDGVYANKTKAIKYYKAAAEKGIPEALYNLALCYINGNGVTEDPVTASKLLKLAADKGNVNALYDLALLYENGKGVETDKSKAVELYLKAANKGNVKAMYSLGCLYEEENGPERDVTKAVEWYTKAAESDDKSCELEADFALALLYTKDIKEPEKAFACWLRCAELGNDAAQVNLGLCYCEGNGTEKDYEKALYWWGKASEQGNVVAKENIDVLEKSKEEKLYPFEERLRKKKCYIATCVYGTYDCPQVFTLRRYRDYVLDKKIAGKIFIRTYYILSSAAVKLFGKAKWFKKICKKRLDPMVIKLNKMGIKDTPYND